MSDPIKTVIDKMSDELVKVGEAADRKIEKVMAENERLREAMEKIANDEMLDIITATDIAVQALEGGDDDE